MVRSSNSPTPPLASAPLIASTATIATATAKRRVSSIVLRDCHDRLSVLPLEPLSPTGEYGRSTIGTPISKYGLSSIGTFRAKVESITQGLFPDADVGMIENEDLDPEARTAKAEERDDTFQLPIASARRPLPAAPATTTMQQQQMLYVFNPSTFSAHVLEDQVRQKRRTQSEQHTWGADTTAEPLDVDDRSFYTFATVSAATSRRISLLDSTVTSSSIIDANEGEHHVRTTDPVVSEHEGVVLDFGPSNDTFSATIVPLDETETVSATSTWTDWLSFPWTATLTKWIMSMLCVRSLPALDIPFVIDTATDQ